VRPSDRSEVVSVSDGAEPSIHALDDATVRRIAAGEVVERPASVVKELVENALDAGAGRIAVGVEAGGTDGIRVRDDGGGMTAAELAIAVEEHTTSKIDDADDLAGLATLGFRGEALYTIGAVSRTTIRSRPPDAAHGHELTVTYGDAGEPSPVGCPPGTVVEVEGLFDRTPARREFLGTTATEFDHVGSVVTQYALANPEVAVSLEHDGREVFATDGRGDLEAAVLAAYGREVAESMVRVDADGDGDGEGPVRGVRGLVSHPETSRSTREYLATFVNGRYVPAATLRTPVLDAYGGQLATDRYPFAVLFVDVDPAAVDANVHPRKTEVRFDDEPAVRTAVESAVRGALLEHGLVRSTAPRGRGAPDETPVEPEAPTDEAVGGAGTAHERAAADRVAETDDGDATADPATADEPASRPSPRRFQSDEPVGPAAPDADAGSTPTDAETPAGTVDPDEPADATGTATATRPEPEPTPAGDEGDGAGAGPDGPADASGDDDGRPSGVVAATDQRTLDGEVGPARTFERLPRMRLLGQLHDTYLVAETPDGLALVDQHAADERVNYERLRAELSGETPTQALAEPVAVELTAREAALFDTYADALSSLGFHAGRTDERTVTVRSVPAVFDATLDPSLLRDALGAVAAADDEAAGERTVEAVADDLLADLACYPSVTGDTALTEGSVVDLLAALDDCENPYACPHGRPTVVLVDDDELAERFERDYPGHGDRRTE
jgi:DNA mismatch repair protein MutL